MNTQRIALLILIALSSSLAQAATEKLQIGRFQSRAIWTSAQSATNAPAIILIPGSGANGPEEIMPSSMTADDRDHALFSEISTALNQGGVHTLALGKPGIEFFSGWDKGKWFYDRDLYQKLQWQDLIDNLAEAVRYLRQRPDVDPDRIYVLGHSEGTAVAIDYAETDPALRGIILLGYAGEDLASIIDWQMYRRDIEHFIATDMDTDHDGNVTPIEASRFPEFKWNWKPGQTQITYSEIEAEMRRDPERIQVVSQVMNSPLYSKGIINRGPIHSKAASLKHAIWVYTGELDLQTVPGQAIALKEACLRAKKANCNVEIVNGLGHAFSPPKKPRAHPFLDMTLGPVDSSFRTRLTILASHL